MHQSFIFYKEPQKSKNKLKIWLLLKKQLCKILICCDWNFLNSHLKHYMFHLIMKKNIIYSQICSCYLAGPSPFSSNRKLSPLKPAKFILFYALSGLFEPTFSFSFCKKVLGSKRLFKISLTVFSPVKLTCLRNLRSVSPSIGFI